MDKNILNLIIKERGIASTTELVKYIGHLQQVVGDISRTEVQESVKAFQKEMIRKKLKPN